MMQGVKRALRGACALVVAAGGMYFSGAGWAQSADNGNFDKLDGVIAQCIASTKRRYARSVCDRLAQDAREYARSAGIPLVYLGAGAQKKSDKKSEFAHPLQLIFYVRGTRGKNVGATVRISAGVDFDGAIEGDGGKDQIARRGFLVLWEQAVVGEGTARKMASALSRHMSRKMQALFDLLAAAKSR